MTHGSERYRIAVVGAGQLGSRHLQGLARVSAPADIHVMDPSVQSLATARARLSELALPDVGHRFYYHEAIATLPATLDYAVIATSADVRLAVLRALLGHSGIKALLLEKVLFQRLADYDSATVTIAEAGATAWVNCPRRAWSIYADIRAFFAGENIEHFQVRGGNWGLGCNNIHFLDLLAMLTGSRPASISANALDPALMESKRAGFLEFSGSLTGVYENGAVFELASVSNSPSRLLLTVRSAHRSCLVDETAGTAFLLDTESGAGWTEQRFRAPFMSELATDLAEQILRTGECPLAPFAESAALHVPMIRVLADHAAAHAGTPPGFCPIT